ncbi:hypothetical protein D9M70_536660 [compost metagenome]
MGAFELRCPMASRSFVWPPSSLSVTRRNRRSKTSCRKSPLPNRSEGFDDLGAARECKRTSRTHPVEYKPIEPVTGAEIVALREKLQMPQGVFAQAIHAKPAPLKNWEQNR